jgi:hypothetical protein
MTRAAIVGIVSLFSAAALSPPVTVLSPCKCLDAHGKGRWAVKTDYQPIRFGSPLDRFLKAS